MMRNLKKRIKYILSICVFLLSFFVPVDSFATAPTQSVGFHGYISSGGSAVTGSKSITFQFYNALSGGSSEGSLISKTVTVSSGYFSTSFSESDLSGINFNQSLWIEIVVEGDTLSPRVAIDAVPTSFNSFGVFAYSSAPTVGDAGSLYYNTGDNKTYVSNGSIWVELGGSQWTTSDSNIYYNTGNIGIGTTSPYAKLSVVGPVVAEYFHATSTTATSTFAGGLSAASSLYVLRGGNVGVGTTSPYSKLSVAGQIVASNLVSTSTTATSSFAGPVTLASHCITNDSRLRRRRKKDGNEEEDEDVSLSDIEEGDIIESFDESSNSIIFKKVNSVFVMGVKDIIRLFTECGWSIKTTDEHPYFVKDDNESKGVWRKVRDLKVGALIAVVDSDTRKVVWDKIKSLENLPAEEVFDLEVEGTHTFVANNIVAHNTYITGGLGVGVLNTSSGTFALKQSGTNAVILGDTSGNARGSYAVDMQSIRASVAQVASGSCSSALGLFNTASGDKSSALGYYNTASGSCSSALGYLNTASVSNSSAFGNRNTASGSYSSASGFYNTASGSYSSAFGNRNTASGYYSSAFGNHNTASGSCSSALGLFNTASGDKSSAYGYHNTASGSCSSASGFCNTACGFRSSASGFYNTACGSYSSASGFYNTASGSYSSALGDYNIASGSYSSASGYGNTASGYCSSAFGYCNTALGGYSSVFGIKLNNGSCNSAMVGVCNGYINIFADSSVISSTGACLTSGGTWTNASDRNLKENFVELDKSDILSKINSLPITKWNYKAEDNSVLHIGPMAQDFYEIFGLGNSNKAISTIDPAGIALVGVQALSGKINDLYVSLGLDPQNHEVSLLSKLKTVGIEIVDNVIHFVDVVVGKIMTSELIIKNEQDISRTGFVIYDRATREPICVFFEDGVQKTEPGDCSSQPEPQSQQAGGGSEVVTGSSEVVDDSSNNSNESSNQSSESSGDMTDSSNDTLDVSGGEPDEVEAGADSSINSEERVDSTNDGATSGDSSSVSGESSQ